MKTITTNPDIVKLYNYKNIQEEDFLKIKNDFEQVRIPCVDNFLEEEDLNFLKTNLKYEGINQDDVIRPGEKGYKAWRRKYKKLKNHCFLKRLNKKSRASVEERVKQIDSKVFSLMDKMGYKIVSHVKVFRNTLTENEDLHFDIFNPPPKNTGLIRVFINLDDDYRVWRNSLNIYEYTELNLEAIKKLVQKQNIKIHLRKHEGEYKRFNHFLSTEVLDSPMGENCDSVFEGEIALPKIETKFAPGCAWVCDSIQSSHQIYYGKRCLNYDFRVDADSYIWAGNIYSNRIKPTIKRLNEK